MVLPSYLRRLSVRKSGCPTGSTPILTLDDYVLFTLPLGSFQFYLRVVSVSPTSTASANGSSGSTRFVVSLGRCVGFVLVFLTATTGCVRLSVLTLSSSYSLQPKRPRGSCGDLWQKGPRVSAP